MIRKFVRADFPEVKPVYVDSILEPDSNLDNASRFQRMILDSTMKERYEILKATGYQSTSNDPLLLEWQRKDFDFIKAHQMVRKALDDRPKIVKAYNDYLVKKRLPKTDSTGNSDSPASSKEPKQAVPKDGAGVEYAVVDGKAYPKG